MGVTIVILLILTVVVGGVLWAVKMLKPKVDEDVITVEPEPKKGTGTALATIKPDRIESEIRVDKQVKVYGPKHEIESTGIGWDFFMNWETYKWRCRCGVGGKGTTQYSAQLSSNDHVRTGNRAEELKTQTNGRFSW